MAKKILVIAVLLAIVASFAYADGFENIAAGITRLGNALTASLEETDAYAVALTDAAAVGNPEVNAAILKHMDALKKAEKKRRDAVSKLKH